MKPTLGRIVHYTNRYGNLAPAIVIGTKETTNPAALARWIESGNAPEGVMKQPIYPTEYHVDLKVLGLGGDYYEYRVPQYSPEFESEQTWFYPTIKA